MYPVGCYGGGALRTAAFCLTSCEMFSLDLHFQVPHVFQTPSPSDTRRGFQCCSDLVLILHNSKLTLSFEEVKSHLQLGWVCRDAGKRTEKQPEEVGKPQVLPGLHHPEKRRWTKGQAALERMWWCFWCRFWYNLIFSMEYEDYIQQIFFVEEKIILSVSDY